MKIADISKYQGNVEWDKAAKELAFCIIRASIGETADTKYQDNVRGCSANNIPYHAYHYLKASSETAAIREARCFFQVASFMPPLFYVVDVEYTGIPKDQARYIVSTFLQEIKRLGASKTGIYVGHHLYSSFDLATDEADYLWIPRYGKNSGQPETLPAYECDLWQYTSAGVLTGVSGNVDLNKIISNKPLSWFIAEKEENMSNASNRALLPFTNEHFVAFLKSMLGQPYWYGTCLYKCRKSVLSSKTAQYPSHYTDSRQSTYNKHVSAKLVCADCIGVAKGYAWTGGGVGVIEAIGTDSSISNKYGSNGCPDKGTSGMFAYAKTKGMSWGTIDTVPELPGVAVTTSGHVGFYIGNGKVIEFKGFAYGCVTSELAKGKWTNWYMLPFIDYGTNGTTAPTQPSVIPDVKYTLGSRLLKSGSNGNDVAELQKTLVELGYDLGTFGDGGVDGNYGAMTERAVRKFQNVQQIEIDGKYGSVTHAALMGVIADISATIPDDNPDAGNEQTQQGKRVTATGSSVNVRTGPDTAYKIITRINKGDAYPFVATADAYGWHAIVINGKIGWISGKYSEIKE